MMKKRSKAVRKAPASDTDVPVEFLPAEGVESEDDLELLDPSILGKAVVSSTDWTAETIIGQLAKGNIVLDPIFQRRDAWTAPRKSKFIESALPGI